MNWKGIISCLVAGAGLAFGACGVSPQPEPPNAEPPKIALPSVSATPESSVAVVRPTIEGGQGAVSPAAGSIRAYDLDNTMPPAQAAVANDGSFSLLMPGMMEGDEIRMQVITDEGRSVPVDFLVGPSHSTTPSTRALADCLLLSPALEVDLGQVSQSATAHATVMVENHCSSAVQISAPTMRVPVAGLSVSQGAVVDSSSSVAVDISLQPSSLPLGEAEEILFIEALAPSRDRRPITVRAQIVP